MTTHATPPLTEETEAQVLGFPPREENGVTESFSPQTGEKIGETPLHSLADLQEAIKQAKVAQKVWAATPVKERARVMLRVRDYIVDHADEISTTISQDNGKTRVDALASEVAAAALATNFFARFGPRFLRDRKLPMGSLLLFNKRSKIIRVPFGVVGIISPWNYPFSIPFAEVVMGLMAGNAVILKTASQTQLVGRAIENCFRGAGVPKGVFTFINLPGAVAGGGFLDCGVDKLFFTGSVPIGKKLMAKAAETLTPVSLELGGNDAMLVCPDADLERATSGAVWGGLQNCGQSCGGVERVYVHKDIYPEFLELLAKKVRSLRVGVDQDHHLDLGAMTTTGQVKAVQAHIDEALERGAVIYAQSSCPEGGPGQFLPATVLTEVDHNMKVMLEETFGPVLGVMKVDSMEQAVELANDSNLGLTGSIWSRDSAGAERLARRVQAGAITINDHLMSHGLAETPWGGFKESGIGRTHGDIGFSEMTEAQVIVHDFMPGVRKNMWWHPHGPEIYRGLLGALDLLYGKSLWKRFTGLGKLLKIYGRSFKP